MEIKAFPVNNIKALGESDPEGTFEAVVAVFGNIDRYGDRVEPGAFTDTLKSDGFPAVVWSHKWGEPPIGCCLEATETSEGLLVKGQLFIEDNQRAREVYAAMKTLGGDGQPPLREFSFAYDIVEGGWTTENEEEFYSLKALKLIEVGPCLKGVNEETRLVGVKGLGRERPPRPSEDETKSDEPTPEAAEARTKARDLMTAVPLH